MNYEKTYISNQNKRILKDQISGSKKREKVHDRAVTISQTMCYVILYCVSIMHWTAHFIS